MKITHVTTRVLRTPADNPLVVGLPEPTDTREFVTLELGTDQGLVGLGLTFFGAALTPALKVAVDTLAGLTIGDDPSNTEAIASKLRRAAGSSGPGGIFSLALSAVDIACWDLKGKAAGKSVCALLGDLRDRVPTYASGALMRQHAVDYLAKAGPRLVDMGFRQMKMQCGSEPTIAASVERLRAGGITQWMKIAGMAEAFNVPVVSHLIPEIHLHLVAAIPNGLTVEYMPWTLRLYEELPAMDGGRLVVPKKPGLGLAFDESVIKKYQVA